MTTSSVQASIEVLENASRRRDGAATKVLLCKYWLCELLLPQLSTRRLSAIKHVMQTEIVLPSSSQVRKKDYVYGSIDFVNWIFWKLWTDFFLNFLEELAIVQKGNGQISVAIGAFVNFVAY